MEQTTRTQPAKMTLGNVAPDGFEARSEPVDVRLDWSDDGQRFEVKAPDGGPVSGITINHAAGLVTSLGLTDEAGGLLYTLPIRHSLTDCDTVTP